MKAKDLSSRYRAMSCRAFPASPFRRALFSDGGNDWGEQQGIRVIHIEEMYDMGIEAVIAEARRGGAD